jgi:hypothetical protein
MPVKDDSPLDRILRVDDISATAAADTISSSGYTTWSMKSKAEGRMRKLKKAFKVE